MPCVATDQLTIVSASSNAQFETNSAARLIDGVAAYEHAFSANMATTTNTGSTGGFDQRSSDAETIDLTLDLGGTQCVQAVEIQWNYPAERQYNYTLWTSLDGSTFAQQGGVRQSAGLSASGTFESVDIGGVQARYVRIAVDGNTVNGWVVIEEARAVGDQLVNPPNGYTITIDGTDYPIYGQAGDNTVSINPDLPPGTYSYTVSTPQGETCTGTFVVEDSGLERRCLTLNQAIAPGNSIDIPLTDADDGAGGTPVRFVVVHQPATGSISVSADGRTLTLSLPVGAVGASCGAVDVEYDTGG